MSKQNKFGLAMLLMIIAVVLVEDHYTGTTLLFLYMVIVWSAINLFREKTSG